MKIIKAITIPSIFITLFTITGFLFINLFFIIQVNGEEIQVNLHNPQDGALLSGNILASAETNSPAAKVEFYFLDESGRFTFTYEGINVGNNVWEYTWSTDESIDGVYRVHAVAVDANNLTYISDINRIYVDNAGGSIPDFDGNSNSTPIENYNVNQNFNLNSNQNSNANVNQNSNSNLNFNGNENVNQNTNSDNINVNIPINSNFNLNTNTSVPLNINSNSNISTNSNEPIQNSPDKDNDGLTDTEEGEIGTDISNPDSDNDGLKDSFEENHGFSPLIKDNNTPSRTPDQRIIQAIMEATTGGQEKAKDSDLDGIPDVVETAFGSNPYNPDTSGDGLTDGFKAYNGYPLLEDNSGQIAKTKLDLPNPDMPNTEKSSLTTTIAIFGSLILVVFIVLIVFRPKAVK
ncbi:MAG: hypothetical protein WCW66_01635 [Patescibacteria group bacterium]|jgi:hypothetical protein